MAYCVLRACVFATFLAFVLTQSPALFSSSSVATLGVPFRIFVRFDQTVPADGDHYIKFGKHDQVMLAPSGDIKVPTSPFVLDVVASACPRESAFEDLQVKFGLQNGTDWEEKASLAIGLQEGARISATLQLGQKATLSLENPLYEAPISNLICSFNSDPALGNFKFNKTTFRNGKPQYTTVDQSIGCKTGTTCDLDLGDMIGHTKISVFAPVPSTPKTLTLHAKCTASFGSSLCPAVVDITATLKPGVTFEAPNLVTAGENIIFSISQVEEIQECSLVLPNEKDYHLVGSVSGCTQKGINITCSVNRSVDVPVHVDASAQAHNGNLVSLRCAKAGTQQHTFNVTVSSEVDKVEFGGFLRVLKPSRFNVSFVVTNKGPSDLKDLQCTFSYPDDLDAKPNASCVLINETDSYECPIKIGNLAGRDASGKAGSVNHTVTFDNPPDAIWGVSSRFSVTCGGKSAQKTLKVNDTDLVVLGKPPVETPMQNDGYFWTYAIVIVNLFVIALVVFVGMWWRNRAIAKTMEGRGGAGGFTEMELFSEGGGRLPMSKAD